MSNGNDIIALKELTDIRIKALEKATDLAAENIKIRLDSLNEW